MKDILHFHLPRTGGTALRHFFVDQVGESSVSKPITGMKLRDALLQWEHAKVISGHFAAFQGDRLPSSRYSVTVLRNPVDRFLSDHFFRKHNNATRVIDTSLRVSEFDHFLQRCAQDPPTDALVQLDMLSPLALGAVTNPTLEEQLQAAMRAIDAFDAVGVQEELDDFALMLCAEFGWAPKPVTYANPSARRVTVESLTPSQRAVLHQVLAPELQLYDYALTRFRNDRRRYLTQAGRTSALREGKIPEEEQRSSENAAPTAGNAPLEFGDRRCEILDVEATGATLGPHTAMAGERMSIKVKFVAHEIIDALNIGIAIKDERGGLVFGTNSLQLGQRYAVQPGRYEVVFSMLNRLGCGHYTIDAALVRNLTHLDGCYHWREQASTLEVPSSAVNHFIGRVLLDVTVGLEGMTPESAWSAHGDIALTGVTGSLGTLHDQLSDFRAALRPMAELKQLKSGVDTLLQVWISNQSESRWPSTGRNPVNVSYRWLGTSGELAITDGLRTSLPEDLLPATTAIVPMHIRTPNEPGHYILQASLVQEQNAWFIDQECSSGFTLPVTVSITD